MITDFTYLKLAIVVVLVLAGCYILWKWADKQKKSASTLDERYNWCLMQALALIVALSFIGIAILVITMLEGFKVGMI